MPEAVVSNSTRTPTGQPKFGWKRHFSEGFEDVDAMLSAFREMNSALYETKQDHSHESRGIYLIQGLIMDRLRLVSDEITAYVGQEEASVPTMLGRGIDLAIWQQINNMDARVLLDAGMIDDPDGPWPDGVSDGHAERVARGYNDIVTKAQEDGSVDLLTIGSYLPWLELRIRREIGAEVVAPGQSDTSFRDRLIVEQSQKGISPSDLSQAFGIKRASIERIICRLTATEEESRKAV